nr:MAG TPA: hypothetical protein [Caudoviricetes sp.]
MTSEVSSGFLCIKFICKYILIIKQRIFVRIPCYILLSFPKLCHSTL